MSSYSRGGYNERRRGSGAPHRDNRNDNENRHNYRGRGRGRGNFRGRGGFNNDSRSSDSSKPSVPRTPRPPRAENLKFVELPTLTISPNTIYHYFRELLSHIDFNDPESFHNAIDTITSIHTQLEYIRIGIMKIGSETAPVIDASILNNISPTSVYQTLFPKTMDIHITPETHYFDPNYWFFVYFNALNGIADGVRSIIDQLPSTYFERIYAITRLFHICVRKVGLSLKREYLKTRYAKYFMTKQELLDAEIVLTPDEQKEKERIWKEYDDAKSTGIYIVSDLCKTYGTITTTSSKDEMEKMSDAFVNHCHKMDTVDIIRLWQMLFLNPFFAYDKIPDTSVPYKCYDYGIVPDFHLFNTIPSNIVECCNHIAALRDMQVDINIATRSAPASIENLRVLMESSDSETDNSSTTPGPILSDVEQFEYNRLLYHVIFAKSKMLEIVSSEDLMQSWATAISLIHDNYIQLYRGIEFGREYGQFSSESRVYEQIAKPGLQANRDLAMMINKYNKADRIRSAKPFIETPVFQTLRTYHTELVVSNIIDSIQTASMRESSVMYYSTSAAAGIEMLYGLVKISSIVELSVIRNCLLEYLLTHQLDAKKINTNLLIFIAHWLLRMPELNGLVSADSLVEWAINDGRKAIVDDVLAPINVIIERAINMFDVSTPRQMSMLESFIIFIRSVKFIDATDEWFITIGSECWNAFKSVCESFISGDNRLASLRWKLTDYEIESFDHLPKYRSIVKI